MLDAIKIIFNGLWGILSCRIPVTSSTLFYNGVSVAPISFTLWQYFLFIIIVTVIFKLFISKGVGA